MEKIVQDLHSELDTLESKRDALEIERHALNLQIRDFDLKIQGIKNLLEIYEPSSVPAEQSSSTSDNTQSAEQPNGHSKPSSELTKNKRMENAIVELLNANGEMHRQKIVEHLMAQGIMGGESNPVAHLAAFLSTRRNLFISDGRGNFRLV